jgi:hypothetical protein
VKARLPARAATDGTSEDLTVKQLNGLMYRVFVGAAVATLALPAMAAQLDGDARGVIPKDVQQLVAVDYRAMQNSPAAMQLKKQIMPPELKGLEDALKNSGLNENNDVEQLVFANFRYQNANQMTRIIGVAQGQFPLDDIMANFKKKKIKPLMVRDNKIFPMGASGMQVVFLSATTMVFGQTPALKDALSARDGLAPSLLTNNTMLDMMLSVDREPIWSILDQGGTQTMMQGVMGQAAQVTDYEPVKKRLLSSWYTMDFQNGVKFNLTVLTPDTFSAATMASLLNAAALYKKMSGTPTEKAAIDATKIDSDMGKLNVNFATSDSQFDSLLQSPLFKSVVQ